MKQENLKLVIIGAGPAGYTAAIYAARANLQPMLFQGQQPGGQLTITTEVENYPGFGKAIQGPWLMEQMYEQAKNVGTNFSFSSVTKVDFTCRPFSVITDNNIIYKADAVIIATGAQVKWLGLTSESYYKGFGVSGCATCDGFFYKEQNVAVIGGGNTAVEEALFLTNFAKHVTLIHRRNTLKAEKILQDRLFKNHKISVQWDSCLEEVIGTKDPKIVTGIRIKNIKDNIIKNLDVSGVFIAIGHSPATKIFKEYLLVDDLGYILCTPGTTKTNVAGVFAAGDVQDKIYRQAITAAGQGCMAALEAEAFLNT